ncbi:MAG: peptidylprolyl isomerase [Haliea sp.]|nr:peptidylprolyl isomerase [Haliea sp.]
MLLRPAFLRAPWFHFLLLGVLLYVAQAKLFPTPPPVVGPLPEARTDALVTQWVALTGRQPEPAELAHLQRNELEQDMLFQRALSLELHRQDPVVQQRLLLNLRFLGLAAPDAGDEALFEQALAMRLHLGDEVVRRRMIQVMEQLILASAPPAAPTEAELQAAFTERSTELARPPRYSLQHLYFSREREPEVAALVSRIEREGLGPAEALPLSSPFLHGYAFRNQTPDQLARLFGAVFVDKLVSAATEPGRWQGPLRSAFGLHLIWLDEFTPARPARLDEVRDQLARDLQQQARTIALQAGIARIANDYEFIL